MKVRCEYIDGLNGAYISSVDIDTDMMTLIDAEEVRGLLIKLNVFDMPSKIMGDGYNVNYYRISVTDKDKRYQREFIAVNDPPELIRLIQIFGQQSTVKPGQAKPAV